MSGRLDVVGTRGLLRALRTADPAGSARAAARAHGWVRIGARGDDGAVTYQHPGEPGAVLTVGGDGFWTYVVGRAERARGAGPCLDGFLTPAASCT